jgi:hypothetical protein
LRNQTRRLCGERSEVKGSANKGWRRTTTRLNSAADFVTNYREQAIALMQLETVVTTSPTSSVAHDKTTECTLATLDGNEVQVPPPRLIRKK